MHLKLVLRHRFRWTGVGWGGLAFVELGALEVGATPSSSLDCGGVGHFSVR